MSLLSRVRRRPILFAGFAFALALTLFFAVRVVLFTIVWSDPVRRNQPIEGWMTPGYVAHSWHVPREIVADALGPDAGVALRGQTLDEIARAHGMHTAALIADLDAAIAAHRAEEGPDRP